MSNTLSEFEIARYKLFAVRFVEKYIEAGRLAAGILAVSEIKKKDHEMVKPFIDEEFLRRGYVC